MLFVTALTAEFDQDIKAGLTQCGVRECPVDLGIQQKSKSLCCFKITVKQDRKLQRFCLISMIKWY